MLLLLVETMRGIGGNSITVNAQVKDDRPFEGIARGFCQIAAYAATAPLRNSGGCVRRACGGARVGSFWWRAPEAEVLAPGYRFRAIQPLGKGFLSGKIDGTSDLHKG